MFSVLLGAGTSNAQYPLYPPRENPSPSPTPEVRIFLPRIDINALGIKAEFREAQYLLKPTEEDRLLYLLALEEYLQYRCMLPLIETLNFLGSAHDPECSKLIEKTLELDPDSPPALCARDGIEAVSCQEAYGRQLVWDNEQSLKLRHPEYQRIVQERAQEHSKRTGEVEFRKAYEEARRKEQTFRTALPTKKELTYLEMRLAWHPVLPVLCEPYLVLPVPRDVALGNGFPSPSPSPVPTRETQMFPDDPVATNKRGRPSPSPAKKDSMAELLELLDKKKENLSEEEEFLRNFPENSNVRIRFVGRSCDEAIQMLLKIDPTNGDAICHRDGYFSTYCTLARRIELMKILQAQEAAKAAAAIQMQQMMKRNQKQGFGSEQF